MKLTQKGLHLIDLADFFKETNQCHNKTQTINMKQASIHIEWHNNGTNSTSQPQVVYNSETTQSISNFQDHPDSFQLSESDCFSLESKQTSLKTEDDAVLRDASGKCQQQQMCNLLEPRPSAKGGVNGIGSGDKERNN